MTGFMLFTGDPRKAKRKLPERSFILNDEADIFGVEFCEREAGSLMSQIIDKQSSLLIMTEFKFTELILRGPGLGVSIDILEFEHRERTAIDSPGLHPAYQMSSVRKRTKAGHSVLSLNGTLRGGTADGARFSLHRSGNLYIETAFVDRFAHPLLDFLFKGTVSGNPSLE